MGIDELKAKLEKREKIYSTVLGEVKSTVLPEIYKSTGIDFFVLDMEHGPFSPENSSDLIQKCNSVELPVIVRVQDCEYYCISKPLDRGADGIMIPNVKSMEQVEKAIQCMRLAPVGGKGYGGRAQLRKGEILEDFNKNRLLFLQIESRIGTDNLDEMLTRYGDEIAGVIIGPYDMAVFLGCGLDIHAEAMTENIGRTITICKKHSKSIGMWMENDAIAEKWFRAGMNIFWYGTDITMLTTELTRAKAFIGLGCDGWKAGGRRHRVCVFCGF